MASHESIFPLLLSELPGCPIEMVRIAINRTTADFCTKSMAWLETLDPIQLKGGISEYDIDFPSGSALVIVREAKVGCNRIAPVTDHRVLTNSVEGMPSFYSIHNLNTIRLHPVPFSSIQASLFLEAALRPTIDAHDLPEILVSKYYEAISEGAKSLLKRMPNKPWSDPQGAAVSERIFSIRTAEARIDREYGFVQGPSSIKPRRFGS